MRSARPRLRLLVAVALTAAVAFPLGAIASHQFTDVPDSNPFHADIDALADAGVTSGCGTGIYCPKDFVTREQMAAFMNRLGALGPGKLPVVNAKTAKDAENAVNAVNAENADLLDGFDATEFVRPGTVKLRALGGWEEAIGGTAFTRVVYANETNFSRAGAGSATLAVHVPVTGVNASITYALKSARVCWLSLVNGTVTEIRLRDTGTGTGSSSIRVTDTTDRTTAPLCVTLTDSVPDALVGGVSVFLDVLHAGVGTIGMGTVEVTLEPVAPAPAGGAGEGPVDAGQDDAPGS